MSDQPDRTRTALNRLAKWQAIDQREKTIVLRAEVSALTGLLAAKGVFTSEEWLAALEREADLLSRDYELRFPDVRASEP
jgi:hypothetical protein